MKIFKQLFQEQNIVHGPVAQNDLNSYGCQSGHGVRCCLTACGPMRHNSGFCEDCQKGTWARGWAPFPCGSAATKPILAWCNFSRVSEVPAAFNWGSWMWSYALFHYPQHVWFRIYFLLWRSSKEGLLWLRLAVFSRLQVKFVLPCD